MRTLPVLGLTLSLAALWASSAQAAGFGCSASAARVTVLGQKAEPVTANAGGTDCVGENKSLSGAATKLPAPVSAGALVAATEVFSAQKSVLASGGAADLRVASLPTLPIDLPDVAVPEAARTALQNALKTSVDLTAVKDAIDPLGLHPTLALIPDSVAVDGSATLDAALAALLPDGRLPNVELLRIRGAMAYAVGSCQTGSPAVNSSSSVSGISVLGQNLPVGQIVDRTLSLIDSASVDPSKLALPSIDLGLDPAATTLIASIPAAQAALDAAVQAALTTLQGQLDAIADIKVLDPTVAQVKVTPGLQARSGDSVTQQALTVSVSIAGQQIVDAVVGEAQASSAGVDCAEPITDPGTPAGATLQCSTRRLVLVDVLQRRRGVKLFGVADPALAGKKVDLVFNATGSTVARATVGDDGQFRALAPLPRKAIRSSNDARYQAKLGKEESINLKLQRRMVIRSMRSKNGRVTIVGRVIAPLAHGGRAITLTRRVSCNDDKVVKRFRPRRNGRFRITVKAPRGLGTVVYRMTTKVRYSSTGTGLFDTYTLPRAVAIKR